MQIDVTVKKNLRVGILVEIIAEKDKGTDEVTRGYIAKILSRENQKKGIKVELTSGQIGRVQRVVTKDDLRLENFKFYNRFFFAPKIFSIWDKGNRRYFVLDYHSPKGMTEHTAFLFEKREDTEKLMRDIGLSNQEFMAKEINRRKNIHENFKTLHIDTFRVNRDRKLGFDRFNELENYFKNMR